MFKLICVTNRRLCQEDFSLRLAKIAAAGPDAIILREKDLPAAAYQRLAEQALSICGQYEAPCVLHRSWPGWMRLGGGGLPVWGLLATVWQICRQPGGWVAIILLLGIFLPQIASRAVRGAAWLFCGKFAGLRGRCQFMPLAALLLKICFRCGRLGRPEPA